MRLLLISDIHANIDALDACLLAAPEYDAVANLGDVVGYYACPNEVVARSRHISDILVRGNHDRAAVGLTDLSDFNPIAGTAIRWTRNALTEENRAWLQNLVAGPCFSPELPGIQFVHGSPWDEDEYILNTSSAEEVLRFSNLYLTFYGHTHVQKVFAWDSNQITDFDFGQRLRDQLQVCRVLLEEGRKYLVNPGSVGQPRDGDPRAAFALYDSNEQSITLYRVPYDIQRAQARIVVAGLPERLAVRLSEGR